MKCNSDAVALMLFLLIIDITYDNILTVDKVRIPFNIIEGQRRGYEVPIIIISVSTLIDSLKTNNVHLLSCK